jgi:hypothetical protein
VCLLNLFNVTSVRVDRVIPVYVLDMIELLLSLGLNKSDT